MSDTMPVLFVLPPERVFCLTMDPQRLSSLCFVRHERFGGATGDYADYDEENHSPFTIINYPFNIKIFHTAP